MFKVIIEKIDNYDNLVKIKESLLSSLTFLGKKIENKKRYLIKPNLLKAAPSESAITTHPAIIRAVIELIKDFGGIPIIGDSPGFGSTEKVLKKLDLIDFLNSTGTHIADFSKQRVIKNGKNLIYKELSLPEIIFNVDEVINIPKLKTHQMMVLTLAVKNLFGFIYGHEKIKYHFLADKDYSHFGGIILDLYKNINPEINILDGIIGMEGNGPASGKTKPFHILALSNNALSLDYTISNLFSLDINKIPHLSVALKENFMEVKDHFIEIKTKIPPFSQKIELPKAHKLNFSLPDFVSNFVKSFMIPYPFINKNICISCKMCKDICPKGAIEEKDFLSINKKNCIRCYCCQELCEKNAIKIKRNILYVWK